MKYPRISIVTPSYNQGEYLEETILSVINQNYPNLQYIIIDGGSKDNSVDIIKKYEKNIDYWVSEKDKGQSDAINKGFKLCDGEIIAWLNSDDVYEDDTLFKVAEFFNENKSVDLLYGNAVWIDKEGKFIKEKREMKFNEFVWLYDHNFIPQPSTFFKRSSLKKNGYLNMDLHYAMDADLWLRFYRNGQIEYTDQYFSKMRYHEDQKMIVGRKEADIEDLKIRENYLNRRIRPFERKVKYPIAKIIRIINKKGDMLDKILTLSNKKVGCK